MNQPTFNPSLASGHDHPEVPLGPPPSEEDSPQASGNAGAIPASPSQADSDLIEQTRIQIRALVQEITELCQSDKSLAEFHEAFLTRVVAALAGVGGAYWIVTEEKPALAYEINLPQTGIQQDIETQERHARLLRKIIETGSPQLVAPHASSANEEEGSNPTDYLLVLAPLVVAQKVVAVVEVFQRASGGPTTQRGYLRFLTQMADMAVGYLKNHRLRRFGDSESWWEELDAFSRHIHAGLNPSQCTFVIANEGRRLIGADRVSVALRRGSAYEIVAVSGVDQIERRSRSIRKLSKLAKIVAKGGEAVWFQGDKNDLAPPVEAALDSYIDESPSKNLLLLPLSANAPSSEEEEEASTSRRRKSVSGLIIVEQISAAALPANFRQQAEMVAEHSALAISNALEHDQLFLMPLWRTLGKIRTFARLQSLPKIALAVGAIGLLLCLLFVMPAQFSVEGKGKLQPQRRPKIFAPIDGVVVNIPIDHQSAVKKGELLLELRNTEIEVALAELIGRRTAVQEQLIASERTLLDGVRRSPDEQIRLEGSQFELLTSLESLNKQIELYRKKQNDRFVRAPIDGMVVSWNVQEILSHRPVQNGQVLMTVVDLESPWELEIELPENRVGHLNAAREASDKPIKVEFVLATHPNKTFTGQVIEVASRSDLDEEERGVVAVRVAVNAEEIPELRPGATVTARIQCGSRSLAFVWFHDVWEFAQSKIFFRF